MRSGGGHESDRPDGVRGAVRHGVLPHDRGGEQVPGEDHVRVHGQVHGRHVVGRVEQVGPVDEPQPPGVQAAGDVGVAVDADDAGPQHPGVRAGGPPRQGPQQQRDGRGEHEQQGRDHAEDEVGAHVPARVVMGQGGDGARGADGDEHQPGDARGHPRARPGVPAGDSGHGRRRSSTAAPPSRTSPETFHATS